MATYTSHYNLKKPAGNENININDINNNMDLLDTAIWNTLTVHGLLTASDDLNNLNNGNPGIWNIGDQIPLHAPESDSQVSIPSVAWSYLIQIKRGSFIHQYIIRATNQLFLMREYSGNPVAWGGWRVLSGRCRVTRIPYGQGSYVECWKNGSVGCIYAYYKATDGTLATWATKTIATLPSGFRPAQSTYAQGSLDRGDGEGTFVAVESTGDVKVCTRYNAFNNPENIIRVTVTYPIFN